MPTLSIILLGLATALFTTSILLRRPGAQNPKLLLARKILTVLILVFAVYYFYKRFTG